MKNNGVLIIKYLWFVNFKYIWKKNTIKLRKNSSFNWFTPFHVLIRPDVIWKKLSRPFYHRDTHQFTAYIIFYSRRENHWYALCIAKWPVYQFSIEGLNLIVNWANKLNGSQLWMTLFIVQYHPSIDWIMFMYFVHTIDSQEEAFAFTHVDKSRWCGKFIQIILKPPVASNLSIFNGQPVSTKHKISIRQ